MKAVEHEEKEHHMVLHQRIKHKDDSIPCPKCGHDARKEDKPIGPMPKLPKSDENVGKYLGSAFCENQDCVCCQEQELISWEFEPDFNSQSQRLQ